MKSAPTKPSKQQVFVSTVVFWHDAGSDELQLAAAAREPRIPAGLPVPQGLTIRPATTELAARAPAPSTIGVNILQAQRRSGRSPGTGVQLNGPASGVWVPTGSSSYAREAPAICSCGGDRNNHRRGGHPVFEFRACICACACAGGSSAVWLD